MFFGSQLSEGLFYLSLCLFNMGPEVGVSLIRKAHNVASAIFRIARKFHEAKLFEAGNDLRNVLLRQEELPGQPLLAQPLVPIESSSSTIVCNQQGKLAFKDIAVGHHNLPHKDRMQPPG